MSKVVLFAASLLVVAGIASAGIIDPCGSPVDYTGPVIACLFACPQGDGQTYSEAGFTLAFTVNDLGGNPIPDIPASDFWLIDCDPTELSLTLCAGSASSAADSATNSAGQTTMSNGTLNAGGCADGLTPVVQGFLLELAPQCDPYCFDIRVRTPDLDGNLEINLVDLANFSACFPPQLYDKCCDFDCNATVNLQDLARFAFHFGPPGHKCQ